MVWTSLLSFNKCLHIYYVPIILNDIMNSDLRPKASDFKKQIVYWEIDHVSQV
jgi:hypothetical protein